MAILQCQTAVVNTALGGFYNQNVKQCQSPLSSSLAETPSSLEDDEGGWRPKPVWLNSGSRSILRQSMEDPTPGGYAAIWDAPGNISDRFDLWVSKMKHIV